LAKVQEQQLVLEAAEAGGGVSFVLEVGPEVEGQNDVEIAAAAVVVEDAGRVVATFH
jgi:hypothetical protein